MRRGEWKYGLAAFLLVLGISGGITYGVAAMESRTYNRLTCSDTTWWDALWVELRVDCQAQRCEP